MTIDKIATVALDRIGGVIGMADNNVMLCVRRAMAVFLGMA